MEPKTVPSVAITFLCTHYVFSLFHEVFLQCEGNSFLLSTAITQMHVLRLKLHYHRSGATL